MSTTVVAPSNVIAKKEETNLSYAENDPFGLILLSLDEEVYIRCKNDVELRGRLHAYDEHLNLILSDVTETTNTMDLDFTMNEMVRKKQKRRMEMLFVRGDGITMISPPSRTV